MTPSPAPMLKCPDHFLKGKERELFARSSYAAHLGLEMWWLFRFLCVVLCVRLEKWRKLLQSSYLPPLSCEFTSGKA